MEGRIMAAVGGCAVLAGVAYILQGAKKTIQNIQKTDTVPGLVNLGNTCYLNSVLQALAAVSVFVSWIDTCTERNKSRQKLTSELSKFMQILSKPCFEQESYDPTAIFQCLYSHGWVISLEQQDAHEIFQVLTSTLADEQEMGSKKNWNSFLINEENAAMQDESIILRSGVMASKVRRKSWSPFVGLFANQLSCKTCSNKYPVKFDSFDTISLSLSRSNCQLSSYNLQALIRHFMCSEMLESFECPGCDTKDGGKKRLLKKLSIGKPPQCLCFHINRTYWQDNGVPYKNNAFVRFSETLNIEPFLYTQRKVSSEISRIIKNLDSPCSSKDSSITAAPRIEEPNTIKTTASQSRVSLNTVYSLVAVIVHLGGVENGHYVTYKKTEWQEREWNLVSDETTRSVPVSHVLNSTAYMLFYQRTTQSRSTIV